MNGCERTPQDLSVGRLKAKGTNSSPIFTWVKLKLLADTTGD